MALNTFKGLGRNSMFIQYGDWNTTISDVVGHFAGYDSDGNFDYDIVPGVFSSPHESYNCAGQAIWSDDSVSSFSEEPVAIHSMTAQDEEILAREHVSVANAKRTRSLMASSVEKSPALGSFKVAEKVVKDCRHNLDDLPEGNFYFPFLSNFQYGRLLSNHCDTKFLSEGYCEEQSYRTIDGALYSVPPLNHIINLLPRSEVLRFSNRVMFIAEVVDGFFELVSGSFPKIDGQKWLGLTTKGKKVSVTGPGITAYGWYFI